MKILLSWSSGKDSAWALHMLNLQYPGAVQALLTTVNEAVDRVACVDTRILDASFVGREFDPRLLEDLPPGIDPCGENGEFHTCVYAGPMFQKPLGLEPGEVVTRSWGQSWGQSSTLSPTLSPTLTLTLTP
jgi:diphthamide synthase (EF-2-diphthine--ammonia ligase)